MFEVIEQDQNLKSEQLIGKTSKGILTKVIRMTWTRRGVVQKPEISVHYNTDESGMTSVFFDQVSKTWGYYDYGIHHRLSGDYDVLSRKDALEMLDRWS